MVKVRPAFAIATLVALAAAATAAAPLPSGKSGLWIVTQHVDNGRTFISRLCSDETTQANMLATVSGVSKRMCGRLDMAVDGNEVHVDALCHMGRSLLSSRTVITYSSDTAFHVVSDSTFSPAAFGKTQTHAVIDAQWRGSCSIGMAPGDMVGPTGLHVSFTAAGLTSDGR